MIQETDCNTEVLEDTVSTPEVDDKQVYATDIKSGEFKQQHEITTPVTERDVTRIGLSSFNYPGNITYNWMQSETSKLSQEDLAQTFYHHTPLMLMEERIPSGEWEQDVNHAGNTIGISKARYGNTGELKGSAAIEMIRRRGGNGTTIRFPLYRSCIWVTMRPATEQELADLDYRLSSDENMVGRSTAGMLLNAGSGSFNEALVDLALSLIIDTNLTNRAGGMAAALRTRIDILDYTDLISGMLIALYPDGYPWEFTCSNPKCNHVVTGQRVNFARMLWHDKACLTEKQLDMLIKHRKSISDDEILAYRNEFRLTDKDFILLKNADINIHFKTANLDEYLTVSKSWISQIENKYTAALTKYHTEEQRAAYINTQTQIHRFAKYLHLIDKITFPGEDCEIVDPETIAEALTAIDTTTSDYNDFEEAALNYIEAHSITVFGYPSQECTVCGVEPTTAEGSFKSIIPISPDRTFFTLAQLKTMVMSQLGDE